MPTNESPRHAEARIVTDAPRNSESVGDHLFDGVNNHHDEDPDAYTRMYGPLVGYDPRNPTTLFANARQTGTQLVAPRKAREILTGIYSFEPTVLAFQREFVKRANAVGQPELNSDGFSLNGLHTTFDSVRSVSGYPQWPVSALPKSNVGLLRDLKLQEKMTPRQVQIAKEIWRRVWGHMKPTAIKIPKMSTSGPPRNVNDAEMKLQYALALFSGNRYNGYLDAFKSGDISRFYRDYEAAVIMGTNVRWQVDNPGKKRDYWAQADIERELAPSKRPITTKVEINGTVYDDFAAMRTRLVNAGPWTINVALQPFATGCMNAMFELYRATWHPDEDKIADFLEGKHAFFGDVSSYDHSFSEEKIDLSLEVGKEFISPEIMDLASSLFYAAYFTRPLGPDDGPQLVGNPNRYLEKQVKAGNRSGHAFTSLFAKVWKVIDTVSKFDQMGYDAIANMDAILKGDMPFGCINNGDDEIVWFKSERDYRLFLRLLETQPQEQRMFKVSPEEGAVFSGSVYQLVGPLKYQAVERITTPFQRIICPERSIGGNFRRFWPLGILERYNKRNSHPVLEEVWRVFDDTYATLMEPHYGSFLGIVQRAHKEIPFSVDDLSWKEIMVLDDPNKMYHRFTDEEIRDQVQESAFRKLQPSFFERMFKEHYKGNYV